MQKCPFHEDSQGSEQDGELSSIQCPHCGDYRISNIALAQMSRHEAPPPGWPKVVARNRVISTRDTRLLLAS